MGEASPGNSLLLATTFPSILKYLDVAIRMRSLERDIPAKGFDGKAKRMLCLTLRTKHTHPARGVAPSIIFMISLLLPLGDSASPLPKPLRGGRLLARIAAVCVGGVLEWKDHAIRRASNFR